MRVWDWDWDWDCGHSHLDLGGFLEAGDFPEAVLGVHCVEVFQHLMKKPWNQLQPRGVGRSCIQTSHNIIVIRAGPTLDIYRAYLGTNLIDRNKH